MQINVWVKSILIFLNIALIALALLSTGDCSFLFPSSSRTNSKFSFAMSRPIMFLNSITLFLEINVSISVNAIELTQHLNNGSYPNFYLRTVQLTDRGP